MNERQQMTVEVAYGTGHRQEVIEVRVPRGTTLIEAVRASGIASMFPAIDVGKMPMGIFGQLEKHDKILNAHDRVEIYRALLMDPKEARRRRANGQ